MKKGNFRRNITLFLAVIMCISILGSFSTAFAEGESFDGLYADVSQVDGNTDVIKWQKVDGKYYLFLPACANINALTLSYKGTAKVTIDDVDLVNGEATGILADKLEHTLKVNSDEYKVIAMQSANIPAVFITTESGNMDYVNASKDNNESGYTVIVDADGKVEYDNKLSSIKGRGNSTWTCEKKPYNLKLDKKANLFGLGKSKKWSLLANYYDHSLIRNTIMYNFAAEVGILSHDCMPVDVYLNGEYNGSYLLTEKVDIEETKVDIDNMQDRTEEANPEVDIEKCALIGDRSTNPGARKYVDIPNNPEDITGGFILEFDFQDRYAQEVSGFVTKRGQCVVVKEPEYATKAQVDYIADYFQGFEDALYSTTGYNDTGKHYSEYCDIDSLARQYLLQELALNIDAAVTSFFFYKDSDLSEDSMMYCNPTWDFDAALANFNDNRYGYDTTDPTVWYVKNGKIWQNQALPSYLAQAYSKPDVYNSIIKSWNEDYVRNLEILMDDDVAASSKNGRLKSISGFAAELNDSAEMNFKLWNILGKPGRTGMPNTGATIQANIEYLKNFFKVRVPLMNGEFARSAAVSVNSISISAYKDELEVLESTKLIANVLPADATNNEVIWSSSDENTAIISEDGRVTGYKPGEVTITATSKENSEIKATKKLTIKEAKPGWVTVNNTDPSISYGEGSSPGTGGDGYINNDETKIVGFAEFSFEGTAIEVLTATHIDLAKAEIFLDGDSVGVYDWYTSTLLKQQVIYSNYDLTPGKHTIKIVPTGEKNPQSIGTLLVVDAFKYLPEKEDVKIEPVKLKITGDDTVYVDDTIELKAVIIPDVAEKREIIWSSSDDKTAKVDAKGNVTGVGNGEVTIYAKVKDNEVVSASIKINVRSRLVSEITITGNTEMTVGDKQQVKVSVLPENATNCKYTLSSSNNSILTVDAEGNVLAVSEGKAKIIAESNDGNAENYLEITVVNKKEENVNPDEPEDSDKPTGEDEKGEQTNDTKTGDESKLVIWIVAALACMVGIGLAFILKRKNIEE